MRAVREVASRDYDSAQVEAWAYVDRDEWEPWRLTRPTWVAEVDSVPAGFTDLEADGHLDMMFVGTYRSEFYRSIRNLLHAQVAEGSSAAVRRRWDALLRSEAEFRLRREVSAATRVAAHRAP